MAGKTHNPGLESLLKATVRPISSPLSVCFSSRSSAGAWQIRGEQIAATRSNWEAINKPSDDDLRRFDLFCFVKKPDPKIIERVRKIGKPIVFDIVDSWAQPEDGLKYRDIHAVRELFHPLWKQINADGYIFPTRRMHRDLGSLIVNGVTIYHHYWPQIQKNSVRETVKIIGYEGADYLGEWRALIEKACSGRGIQFVANPENYTDLDIVVLARGGEHGSFLAKNYKSNVKLANAYGSGTPALVHVDEMSAHDTDNGDVLFFTNQLGSFERQLDRLVGDYGLRKNIHHNFLSAAHQFDIKNIAYQFERFFLKIAAIKKRG